MTGRLEAIPWIYIRRPLLFVGSLATVEVGFHIGRSLEDRINIGFYHEQRKPNDISEINLVHVRNIKH